MQEIQTILALAHRGQSARALSLLGDNLKAKPNDPDLLHLGGVLSCQIGDLARGISLLRRCAALAPANSDMHFNLAKALLDDGKPEEAARICEPFADAHADHLQLLAAARKATGQIELAVADLEAIVATTPNDVRAWSNLSSALLDTKDAEGALAAADRAIALDPRLVIAHRNRARALARLGQYEDSFVAAVTATDLAPSDAGAWQDRAAALVELDRGRESLQALGNAARIDRGNPKILLELGKAFGRLGEFARAAEAYRFALQADPKLAGAYLNLGIMLENANRLEDLAALIEEARSRGADGPEIHYLEAIAARRSGDFQAALSLAEQAKSDEIDEVLRCQLVGNLADRTGDIDRAFGAFEEMNRAAGEDPAARRFNGSDHYRFVDQLAAINTREEYQSWPEIDIPDDPPAPVFLVGFPRSGTTLLDTILMGHPRTHVLEELPLGTNLAQSIGELTPAGSLAAGQIAELRSEYFRQLDGLAPGREGKLVIDKLPFNLLRAPLLHRIFPTAKFIFAIRHPCDCVLSCFMQSFKINRAMASFLTLDDSAKLYDRAMRFWSESRAFLPVRVHEIRYEDMVSDFEGEVRRLAGFLDLEWDQALLKHHETAAQRDIIRTPSYSQVTEKIYARSSGRWKRYRSHLEPVLPLLEPWAVKFGYGPLDANDGADPE